jgi:hypothetical protein
MLNKKDSEKENAVKLVRETLKKIIAVKRFRQLRQMAIPYAKAKGVITDKDILGNEK